MNIKKIASSEINLFPNYKKVVFFTKIDITHACERSLYIISPPKFSCNVKRLPKESLLEQSMMKHNGIRIE